ncbi:MAG: hypothetical protein OXU66_01630 [Gammaproteobacteria bacterium]|nr:hypothetical protein [Gammaproteobacteria bacterium]MDD9896898.1 hypothetical protein [Gammaproteobacteria bacterium]MDD9957616.1 hypothetical protein [Gammaproteobacteria bacterium]
MSMADEYRVVPETCLTLIKNPEISAGEDSGSGIMLGPEEVEKDILANSRAGPFASLNEARQVAAEMLEQNPSYSLMIVKGLVSIEHLWNEDHWFKKESDEASNRTSRLFVTGLLFAAAILITLTSPPWALGTLILSIAVSALYWEPRMEFQVFVPCAIAIVSAVLYSFLQ